MQVQSLLKALHSVFIFPFLVVYFSQFLFEVSHLMSYFLLYAILIHVEVFHFLSSRALTGS